MYQHRRAAGEGLASAVYNHLNESGHTFTNENVEILHRENNWFERGVHEAMCIKTVNPSLNKQGGARFKLSSAWGNSLDCVREQLRSRVTRIPAIHQPNEDGETPSMI